MVLLNCARKQTIAFMCVCVCVCSGIGVNLSSDFNFNMQLLHAYLSIIIFLVYCKLF